MICPHCGKNVLHRERGKRTCAKCGRLFALEPKESPFRLHDLRMRRLIDRLGDGRNLRYTLPQLWYAAARGRLRDPGETFFGIRMGVSIALGIVIFALAVTGLVYWALALGAGVAALVGVNVLLTALRPRYLATTLVPMPVTYARFEQFVVARWVQVYGAPPAGSVDGRTPLPPLPARPRFAVLCPDSTVLTCLSANNVAGLWGMAPVGRIDQLPPGVPVLVLHDASVPGITYVAAARAALGARVVPVGLAPRAVLGKAKAIRLREGRPTADDLARIGGERLTAAERAWLADGWQTPLASVPPAALLAALGSAVDRVERALDPDRRRAAAVGFLTWPTR
ncbi:MULTISPECIES: hypothetical protein [unclassified Nocardia]|uniref:hypothetical protein n=1 Tax=unclassified Nocardia TaxID=2637762 RepID=UPI0033A3037A